MVLPIAQLGQPILYQRAVEVPQAEILTPVFQQLLDDMRETLEKAAGAGLAGPQVFVPRRIFLAKVLPSSNGQEHCEIESFINPRLLDLSAEKISAWEGCLSFPELMVLVERSRSVRVGYVNAQGMPCTLDLEGFPARVIQHEYDHLEGILTLDRMKSPRHLIKASEFETVNKRE